MTIKLKAPEGCGNVSFQGQEYVADKNGIVDVPAEAAESLTSFGFEAVVEEEKKGSKKSVEK